MARYDGIALNVSALARAWWTLSRPGIYALSLISQASASCERRQRIAYRSCLLRASVFLATGALGVQSLQHLPVPCSSSQCVPSVCTWEGEPGVKANHYCGKMHFWSVIRSRWDDSWSLGACDGEQLGRRTGLGKPARSSFMCLVAVMKSVT